MKNIFLRISLALLFGAMFISCQEEKSLAFQVSSEEELHKAIAGDYVYNLEEFMDFAIENEGEVLLVDLRKPIDVVESDLHPSVNIPLADLLDDDNLELLRSKKYVMLQGEDYAQSVSVWQLLTQLGFENVKVVDMNPASVLSDKPESAKYDFAAVFKNVQDRYAQELEAGKPKPVVKRVITPQPKPKPKKEAVEEEEGC